MRRISREVRYFLAALLYVPFMLADLVGPNASGIDIRIEHAFGLH